MMQKVTKTALLAACMVVSLFSLSGCGKAPVVLEKITLDQAQNQFVEQLFGSDRLLDRMMKKFDFSHGIGLVWSVDIAVNHAIGAISWTLILDERIDVESSAFFVDMLFAGQGEWFDRPESVPPVIPDAFAASWGYAVLVSPEGMFMQTSSPWSIKTSPINPMIGAGLGTLNGFVDQWVLIGDSSSSEQLALSDDSFFDEWLGVSQKQITSLKALKEDVQFFDQWSWVVSISGDSVSFPVVVGSGALVFVDRYEENREDSLDLFSHVSSLSGEAYSGVSLSDLGPLHIWPMILAESRKFLSSWLSGVLTYHTDRTVSFVLNPVTYNELRIDEFRWAESMFVVDVTITTLIDGNPVTIQVVFSYKDGDYIMENFINEILWLTVQWKAEANDTFTESFLTADMHFEAFPLFPVEAFPLDVSWSIDFAFSSDFMPVSIPKEGEYKTMEELFAWAE